MIFEQLVRLNITTRWHCDLMWHLTSHFKLARCRCECIMQLEISVESSGDLIPHWSLMSDAAAHSVHYDPVDINPMKTCCCQKVSPALNRTERRVDVSPKIAFLSRESYFLIELVVRCVTDLPKLAWQDPPTGAKDNGTEALSTNGTLTKCSDLSDRPIEVACEPLLCCTVQLYSQQKAWPDPDQHSWEKLRIGIDCGNVETSAGKNHKQL